MTKKQIILIRMFYIMVFFLPLFMEVTFTYLPLLVVAIILFIGDYGANKGGY
ncbi:MAG: hypothetical protein MJZ34_14565 [Paludibacteraceae bacterium]|nr:hypothetical protein [Paludibacteraceae bacterium]